VAGLNGTLIVGLQAIWDNKYCNMRLILFIFCFAGLVGTSMSQNAEAYFKKGEIKFNTGQYKAAIVLYSYAVKADSNHLNAWYRKGFAHGMLKEYDKAYADYTKVIEKNDTNTWAFISRGSALNKLKRFDEALNDFNRALEIDPTNQEAFNNRGWAKMGLNDKSGACKDWKSSKKLGNGEAKIILKNNHCK